MLDSITKKRIDDLRNILVGKIPSPQSQVEQITTGLIYKFMYDMDIGSVAEGGIPEFFVDDYEKYSWESLFDPKLGGKQKVQLYSDAIESMFNHPTAPSLFREIFKNSFLPFRDPSTLNMFLREINEFDYSHSEKLGDAYEYLLSFMGSQGDAGQFRTPRHIIDFIVEIVNPQKNETILDPACGTAGFLISSYKHILSQNTEKISGDKLTAAERSQVVNNLVGYDISPDMRRISLVNMYLHRFANPQIHEYDTLSSEDRWNEYYDVILANPPFFSPTGGIQPHSRFGVRSKRAEVLFVDYIMEHLTPNGRAGIVVPEGIIFQTGTTAYKTLRKKLIEDCLIGVISLPAGVFQPYSSVKTSILILDKKLNQKSDSIFFAKVENDGFSLSKQRTPISKNDLPLVKKTILSNLFDNGGKIFLVSKNIVLSKSDISLSLAKYQASSSPIMISFEKRRLGDLVEIQSGAREKGGAKNQGIPSIGGGQIDKSGNITSEKMAYVSEEFFAGMQKGKLQENDVLIVKDGATTGKVGIYKGEYLQASVNEHVFVLRCNDHILNHYLFYLLRTNIFQKILQPYIQGIIGGINLSIKDIEIPLPPIEIQQEIVDELERYQNIIDGCRQVVENYKPTIDIDPSWKQVKLEELCTIVRGSSPRPKSNSKFYGGPIPRLMVADLTRDGIFVTPSIDTLTELGATKSRQMHKGDLIIAVSGNPGLPCILNVDCCIHDGFIGCRNLSSLVEAEFLCYLLLTMKSQTSRESVGTIFQNLTTDQLKTLPLSIPSKDKQKEIVKQLRLEYELINANKKLIEIYMQKIQGRISKVWSE